MKSIFSLLLVHCLMFSCQHLKEEKTVDFEAKVLYETVANPERGITYRIQRRLVTNDSAYVELIIQSADDGEPSTVYSYFDAYRPGSPQVNVEIAERRKEWMELCNSHQTADLVNHLYGVDALYYNHKPLIKGRDNIIKEYSYMNREDYSLHLEPLIVEVVNEATIFEIGQCSGSYGGKYVLIWKKEADGIWRIVVDSNV